MSSSSGSVSSNYSDDRVLIIPPSGNINLREDKYMMYEKGNQFIWNTTRIKLVNQSDVLDFYELKQNILGCPNDGFEIEKGIDESLKLDLEPKLVKLYSTQKFNEIDTPLSIRYLLTYSFDENFEHLYSTNFSIYI